MYKSGGSPSGILGGQIKLPLCPHQALNAKKSDVYFQGGGRQVIIITFFIFLILPFTMPAKKRGLPAYIFYFGMLCIFILQDWAIMNFITENSFQLIEIIQMKKLKKYFGNHTTKTTTFWMPQVLLLVTLQIESFPSLLGLKFLLIF